MSIIDRSREAQANLVSQIRETIDRAESESRNLDAEELKKLDSLEAEYARHAETIDVATRNEKRASEAEEASRGFVPAEEARSDADIFRALAFGEMRGHKFGRESRATIVPSVNTVPKDFYEQIFLKASQVGPYLAVSDTIERTSGADLRIPVMTAYSTAGEYTAGSAIADSNPTFSSINISMTGLKFLVPVANELLMDAGFPIESTIAEQGGVALGLKANEVIHAAVTAVAGAGLTAGTTNAVTADELIELAFSVNPGVRRLPSSAFMVSPATAGAIRRLKDGNGTYVFDPITSAQGVAQANGATGTILGYPVFENVALPDLATGVAGVFYGDWSSVKVPVTPIEVATSADYAFNEDVTTYRFTYRLGAGVANGADHIKKITMA